MVEGCDDEKLLTPDSRLDGTPDAQRTVLRDTITELVRCDDDNDRSSGVGERDEDFRFTRDEDDDDSGAATPASVAVVSCECSPPLAESNDASPNESSDLMRARSEL